MPRKQRMLHAYVQVAVVVDVACPYCDSRLATVNSEDYPETFTCHNEHCMRVSKMNPRIFDHHRYGDT